MVLKTPKTKIIALSGPSSSGKSTLARLLRQVLHNALILYEDDFYKAEAEIPINDKGIQDWDCPEAFDLKYLSKVLSQTRSTGILPPDFKSKEESNTLGPSHVSSDDIDAIRNSLSYTSDTQFIIVDGIMLYHDSSPLLLPHQLDLALLLRSPYEDLLRRRNARSGYVTLEGFWKDPPRYFEDVVWPGYVKSHSHLFVDGQVEAALTKTSLEVYKIRTPERMDLNMLELLQWATNQIRQNIDMY